MLAGALTLAMAAAVSGCGGKPDEQPAPRPATLLLDFTPNAVHAGIYSAVARGYDRRAGLRLSVREPASSADAVKLLVAGRADFAVLDIHDLALARERGRDLVGVFALVQRPLAALLAQPGIAGPAVLQGRRVGVTGLPSDDAVVRAMVAGDGGDPRRVRRVTIGFNAVGSLLSRRVAAATGFWNVEGVALRRAREGYAEFRVDRYGAPAYPELVVAVRRRTLGDPELLLATVLALRNGYCFTLAHPAASVDDLVRRAPGLKREIAADQLATVRPAFTFQGGPLGELHPGRLRAWAAWEARFGIVRRAPDVERAFDLGMFPERCGQRS